MKVVLIGAKVFQGSGRKKGTDGCVIGISEVLNLSVSIFVRQKDSASGLSTEMGLCGTHPKKMHRWYFRKVGNLVKGQVRQEHRKNKDGRVRNGPNPAELMSSTPPRQYEGLADTM